MKKMTCGFVAAALVMLATVAAHAAEYQAFDGEKGWRSGLIQFLTKNRPNPEGISIGLQGSRVHAYAMPGSFGGTYSIQRIKHPNNAPSGVIKALVDGGTGRIIGFMDEYCYILTWSKPTS
jgi:hypothetical protein